MTQLSLKTEGRLQARPSWAASTAPPGPRPERRARSDADKQTRDRAREVTTPTTPSGEARRRRPIAATVVINVDHLLAEMESRGITGRDLASKAGISEGTIYNALAWRAILVRNAKLIAGALERIAIEPALARLVLHTNGACRRGS